MCEVPQAEHEKVWGKNPSALTPTGASNKRTADEHTGHFPWKVSWDEAMAFCRAFRKPCKKDFDLPTEAEMGIRRLPRDKEHDRYGNAISPKPANVGGSCGAASARHRRDKELGRTARVGLYSAMHSPYTLVSRKFPTTVYVWSVKSTGRSRKHLLWHVSSWSLGLASLAEHATALALPTEPRGSAKSPLRR